MSHSTVAQAALEGRQRQAGPALRRGSLGTRLPSEPPHTHRACKARVLVLLVQRSPHKSTQGFLGLAGAGQRTALTASVKTSLMPSWVSAEHSRYLTARICLARLAPC